MKAQYFLTDVNSHDENETPSSHQNYLSPTPPKQLTLQRIHFPLTSPPPQCSHHAGLTQLEQTRRRVERKTPTVLMTTTS